MTLDEAKVIVCAEKVHHPEVSIFHEALTLAEKALEELALYNQAKLCLVPADIYKKQCEELDELKEKNTAKKPIDKSKNPTDWHVMACPNCEHVFWNSGQFVRYQPNFCNHCGQSIDWADWGGNL